MLLHCFDISTVSLKQIFQRKSRIWSIRMQRKVCPVQFQSMFLFQSFDTPGDEVAPRSDEITKYFQNVSRYFWHIKKWYTNFILKKNKILVHTIPIFSKSVLFLQSAHQNNGLHEQIQRVISYQYLLCLHQ